MAYDTIMVFDGHFKDHILADRVHMLNVSFLTPRLRREFGGCAANIAYTLNGLGGSACVLASVGHDGADYVRRLSGLGIDTSHILQCEDHFTAQAFITTDLSDNQISAFHPGAMGRAHEVPMPSEAAWGIVAPNGKEAMLRHAREFAHAGIPWIFDPGQALPMFSGEELRELVDRAQVLTVNDYESKLLCEKTGLSEDELAARVPVVIITLGAEGSILRLDGQTHRIPSAAVSRTADPTGCGDAFRGGLLYALASKMPWLQAVRLGSVMGAVKIEHDGPQNHVVSREEVGKRFQQAYGNSPW